MRFLQTEWHRHERDRNAWEIEKQEMKARIASLEGSARRADATQKALKKYVNILEKKVREQHATQNKDTKPTDHPTEGMPGKPEKSDRGAIIQEKLRCEFLLDTVPCDLACKLIFPRSIFTEAAAPRRTYGGN